MIYFTADWHLDHKNIIKYCNRPFNNIYHMNKTILERYKQTIGEEDTVYFLGDLTMQSSSNQEKFISIFNDLPGTKHLVLGNHDKFKPFFYHEIGFSSVHTALQTTFSLRDMGLVVDSINCFLIHDPAWAQSPGFWICGHIHNHWKSTKTDVGATLVNVGVDVWDFTPVSIKEIVQEILGA